jgi:hypothetical protein
MRQCENPEIPVVTTSATWTAALAYFCGTPRLLRIVVELTP